MKKEVKIAIGIIIGVIVVALVLAGGYLFFNENKEKIKVVGEFQKIEGITNQENFEKEQLQEITNHIVATGKYASVEKAGKKYANDIFSTAYELKTLLQDEKMAQVLTASNYQEDGPEFVETKKYLSETKQKLEDGKAQMLAYVEEDKINSYITNETTDEACIALYKQLLAEDINMTEAEKNELASSIDKVVSMLDIEMEVIDFLIANKGKWQIQGEQVSFASNSLVQEYNAFLTRLRIL